MEAKTFISIKHENPELHLACKKIINNRFILGILWMPQKIKNKQVMVI